MTEKQRNMLIGACKALRENPKKAKGVMRDDSGGRCCLCVMDDYAKENSDVEYSPACSALPDLNYFFKVFGIESSAGFNFNGFTLDAHNDGINTKELTHVEIAEMIENRFNLKTNG